MLLNMVALQVIAEKRYEVPNRIFVPKELIETAKKHKKFPKTYCLNEQLVKAVDSSKPKEIAIAVLDSYVVSNRLTKEETVLFLHALERGLFNKFGVIIENA